MKEYVSDEMWERVAFLFPEHRRGGPRKWGDRVMFEAMLFILDTGCRWEALPSCYPPRSTVFDRFQLWVRQKLFQRVLRALRISLPESRLYYLDATIKSAKKGRQNLTSGKNKRQQNKSRNRRERLAS